LRTKPGEARRVPPDPASLRAEPPAPAPASAVAFLLVLALFGVVVPVLVAAAFGAFGIPRSDDWSYLLTLFRFADSGRIEFNNWVSMTLVGQVLYSTPVALVFGRSVRAAQVLTACVGLVGLLAVVDVGRQLLRSWWRAGFVALMVAVGPLWAPLTVSYMTDVPAFAAGMVVLVLGGRAVATRPTAAGPRLGGWFVAGLAAAFVAFSIRQYALVPGVALAVVAGWECLVAGDRTRLRRVLVATGVLLVASAALYLWWQGYSNAKALSPSVPTPHTVWEVVLKGTEFLRLVGLLVAPAVLLAGPGRLVRAAWRRHSGLTVVLGAGAALLQVGIYARVTSTPFVGNYIARDGVLARAVLEGDRPDVVPRAVFDLLVLVGSVVAVVLTVAVVPWITDAWARVRDRRFELNDPPAALVVLTVIGYAAAYALAVAVDLPLYDRYALPVVPLVAFLALRAGPRVPVERGEARAGAPARAARPVLAGIALTLLAVVGLTFAVDSAAFDGTRWEVAERAAAAGFRDRSVNGGFEWVNFHRGRWRQRIVNGVRVARKGGDQPLYCVVVLVNPTRVNPERVVAREVSELPTRPDATFVALRTNRRCPADRDQR
jgi:hypothetical protein